MFYKNQLGWLVKAEVAAQVAHELRALAGSNLPELVQDKLRAEANRHSREREKWENRLQTAFTTT